VPELTRKQMEALYEVFNSFALEDQRSYYRTAVTKFRRSASQVNLFRASFSFLTGFASALAGLLVMANSSGQCGATDSGCTAVGVLVFLLLIIAIVAPVLGGAFSNLADLYQWDRLTTVYSAALENIEVADALSPDAEMPDDRYRRSLQVYGTGTLQVMRDESAQWGQLIRTPTNIEKFLAEEEERAAKVSGPKSDKDITTPGTG
jgi:hypothetical protein